MNQYKCIEVGHHLEVEKQVNLQLKSGWELHSYHPLGMPGKVTHYLLFKKVIIRKEL